jgi:ADP-ribose pyrophosphatase YjhB (NUDIX family)
MIWRDASGRTLDDYPRPSVAVDVALLTVRDGRLEVLVHERVTGFEAGRRSLPGTFVHVDELLADAALRALHDKVGVTGEQPEQLGVFDDPARDDRGRVLSVAHADLVPLERLGVADTMVPAHDPGDLSFDHAAIARRAVEWARDLYRDRPDPRGLAGSEFTLFELQRVHEAVLGERLQKDTFRRRMLGSLRETGASSSGSVGKPARLFTHADPR